MMKYHFKIHKDRNGYWANCIELAGCHTQADNREELDQMMEEALNLYLDEPEDSPVEISLPKARIKCTQNTVKVDVNPKVAFALLLRKAREERQLSQSAMASLMGLNSVFGYQKLESSRYANPTLMKVQALKEILPNLRLDLLFG